MELRYFCVENFSVWLMLFVMLAVNHANGYIFSPNNYIIPPEDYDLLSGFNQQHQQPQQMRQSRQLTFNDMGGRPPPFYPALERRPRALFPSSNSFSSVMAAQEHQSHFRPSPPAQSAPPQQQQTRPQQPYTMFKNMEKSALNNYPALNGRNDPPSPYYSNEYNNNGPLPQYGGDGGGGFVGPSSSPYFGLLPFEARVADGPAGPDGYPDSFYMGVGNSPFDQYGYGGLADDEYFPLAARQNQQLPQPQQQQQQHAMPLLPRYAAGASDAAAQLNGNSNNNDNGAQQNQIELEATQQASDFNWGVNNVVSAAVAPPAAVVAAAPAAMSNTNGRLSNRLSMPVKRFGGAENNIFAYNKNNFNLNNNNNYNNNNNFNYNNNFNNLNNNNYLFNNYNNNNNNDDDDNKNVHIKRYGQSPYDQSYEVKYAGVAFPAQASSFYTEAMPPPPPPQTSQFMTPPEYASPPLQQRASPPRFGFGTIANSAAAPIIMDQIPAAHYLSNISRRRRLGTTPAHLQQQQHQQRRFSRTLRSKRPRQQPLYFTRRSFVGAV